MKMFKRIAIFLVAALSIVCMGLFASACGTAKDFTITVYYSDGTTVVDGTAGTTYVVQLCYYDIDAQELGSCYATETEGVVGADGKATLNIANVESQAPAGKNVKYEVHVLTTGVYDGLALKQAVYVTKDNPTASVILKDVAAPAK